MLKFFLRYSCSRFIMEVKAPVYLQQPKAYELPTTLVRKQGDLYEFENSIFHLQGGGQPNDKGFLIYQNQKYEILGGNIEKQTGTLWYKLPPEAENMPLGAKVTMNIDQPTRNIHAKIHSAGHLLDLAVQRLKYPWVTGKGYHFVDSPYVEYKGAFENAEKTMAELNTELQHILDEKIQSDSKVYGWNEAVEKKIIPETFKTSYVRVIAFGENSCPCGGTHIGSTGQLKELVVTKVQKKSKNVRVYYRVD